MKKFLWAMGVIGFALVAALSVRLLREQPPRVLHIEFSGDVTEVSAPSLMAALTGESGFSVHVLTSHIRRAAQDPSIHGIFFQIGDVKLGLAQLQELADAMAVFKKSGKWSVAYLDTAGEFSSGNLPFALASATDHITVSPTGYVNLVGLEAQSPFFKGTLDLLDIDVLVERRHEYKNAAAPFHATAYSEAHREAIASLLHDIQSTLIRLLATHRGIEEPVAQSWFEQGPYNAKEAAEKGLIQSVGYYDQVLNNLDERMNGVAELVSIDAYRDEGLLYDGEMPVAVIIANGAIHRGESANDPTSDPTVGSDTITRAIRQAREDGVLGILLRVNSPGGSVIASDLIRREVELTRSAGIPVVVSMGDVAASGGYYISLDADYIVAQSGTITGSIGVIAMLTSLHRSLEKNLKVTFDSHRTMENGGFFSFATLPQGERLAHLQQDIDSIYEDFVEKVAKGRKLELAKARELAKGRVWSGTAAHKLGLVDELGDVHLAMKRLQGLMNVAATESVSVEVYPRNDSPLAVLRQLVGASSRVPRHLKQALDAWEMLADPQANTVRLPVVPTIE